jgi:hypothetical protein
MQVVNSKLDGTLSLVDKTWNDAMETAALDCERIASDLCAANGADYDWVWSCARMFRDAAVDLRKQKRRPTNRSVK